MTITRVRYCNHASKNREQTPHLFRLSRSPSSTHATLLSKSQVQYLFLPDHDFTIPHVRSSTHKTKHHDWTPHPHEHFFSLPSRAHPLQLAPSIIQSHKYNICFYPIMTITIAHVGSSHHPTRTQQKQPRPNQNPRLKNANTSGNIDAPSRPSFCFLSHAHHLHRTQYSFQNHKYNLCLYANIMLQHEHVRIISTHAQRKTPRPDTAPTRHSFLLSRSPMLLRTHHHPEFKTQLEPLSKQNQVGLMRQSKVSFKKGEGCVFFCDRDATSVRLKQNQKPKPEARTRHPHIYFASPTRHCSRPHPLL